MAKKFNNLKNIISALFLSKPGRDRPKRREKNFILEFRSYPNRARKFQKKQQKSSKSENTSFRHYFYPNRDEIGRERQKKNLVPNSVPTRPRQGNSKKKKKKIQKIQKHHFGIISFKTGMRQTVKERKYYNLEFLSILTRARKFQKKMVQNPKK